DPDHAAGQDSSGRRANLDAGPQPRPPIEPLPRRVRAGGPGRRAERRWRRAVKRWDGVKADFLEHLTRRKADMYQTDQYEGMIAETVAMRGHNGDVINAYMARPLGAGPFPGMILIHHAPGWDEWYRECTRRFAHGLVPLLPHLYFRDGRGTPDDVGARVR